ncbi:phosphoglycerate mutase protein [Apiospora marii]|uniref:Phosphoglycerate mutase protein n=1 Tax=Apiospora marii TaxID=335849 RepID=A0ABR1S669_9PEZI
MAPHVILIRHGEATHRVLQCEYLEKDLRSRYDFKKDSTLIIVSPAKRTLQTYHHGLKWLSDEGVPVLLRAEWQFREWFMLTEKQETTGNPCDICTEVAVIEKEWPSLDFSQLDPVYPAKTGLYFPSEDALQKRARFAREWLFHRPEKHIVIVTHSGFLQRVAKGQKYRNVEYKMYEFVDEASSQDFKLKEIDHGQAETLD